VTDPFWGLESLESADGIRQNFNSTAPFLEFFGAKLVRILMDIWYKYPFYETFFA